MIGGRWGADTLHFARRRKRPTLDKLYKIRILYPEAACPRRGACNFATTREIIQNSVAILYIFRKAGTRARVPNSAAKRQGAAPRPKAASAKQRRGSGRGQRGRDNIFNFVSRYALHVIAVARFMQFPLRMSKTENFGRKIVNFGRKIEKYHAQRNKSRVSRAQNLRP